MKIAILSDIHLGFGKGSEREGDPYEALAEALEKSQDSDLILVAGDIFDSNNPPAETLALAEEVLLFSVLRKGGARLVKGIGRDLGGLKLASPEGIPLVAIHGTHERRARDLLNPVQALERAGFLVHLHCNGVVAEKQGPEGSRPERVCIQGMSGVPDQYSERVLEEWNPRPQEGCFNILMIHQNLKGFMHERVENQLDPARLNKGFDLYVCGHIHNSGEARLGDSRLIIPGGMVTTQVREGEKPLGFYQVETGTGKAEFLVLESQRKIHLAEASGREEAEREIAKALAAAGEGKGPGEKGEARKAKKPIVRLKVKGDFPVKEFRERFGGKVILNIKREPGPGEEGGERPEGTGLEEQRLSVSELGKKLLRQNLEKQGLAPDVFENVFELLLEKRTEKALELLKRAGQGGEEKAGEKEKREEAGEKKRPRPGKDREDWGDKGELGRFLG